MEGLLPGVSGISGKITVATPAHLKACLEILLEGFGPQIEFLFSGQVPRLFLRDLLKLFHDVYPSGFLVAEDEMGNVSGFILVRETELSWQEKGLMFKHLSIILWRIFSGRYRDFSRCRLLGLFLRYTGYWWHCQKIVPAPAQIVLLTVAASCRRQGLGQALLRAGLDYLTRAGLPSVRLEVRADNQPAVHLYQK
ncbi:MAG TPA: N-acetyltransferase, partial [bacterium]|nr:N-acetyltransferase [bacterium]